MPCDRKRSMLWVVLHHPTLPRPVSLLKGCQGRFRVCHMYWRSGKGRARPFLGCNWDWNWKWWLSWWVIIILEETAPHSVTSMFRITEKNTDLWHITKRWHVIFLLYITLNSCCFLTKLDKYWDDLHTIVKLLYLSKIQSS